MVPPLNAKEVGMDQNHTELLKNKEVVDEINRHKWVESQKVGYDIGFEKAAEDWLKNFSTAWMQYHMPSNKAKTKKEEIKSPSSEKTASSKTRRARSYY